MIDELKGLRADFEQERAERALRQSAYSGLLRFAPENKDQWYNFINILLTALGIILAVVMTQKEPEPPTIVIQNHEQEIVRQLEEYVEQRWPEGTAPGDASLPKEHC
jgi:hypothetical protein